MKTNEDENCLSNESDVKFIPPLYIQRYQKVMQILTENNNQISKVADFGCAEGKLIRRLKQLPFIEEIAFIDCDDFCLEQCLYEARPLTWDYIFGRPKQLKINVFKGSVGERDRRLIDFDAITCIELIEHLNDDVLSQLPQNIFGFIRPKLVIITTPNVEYNVLFPELRNSSKLRHWDHRFEWTRNQFDKWCQSVINSYPDYNYQLTGVGDPSDQFQSVGFCTQIAIFHKLSDNCNQLDSEDYKHLENSYKLIESFTIEKSDRKDTKEEQQFIDWQLITN